MLLGAVVFGGLNALYSNPADALKNFLIGAVLGLAAVAIAALLSPLFGLFAIEAVATILAGGFAALFSNILSQALNCENLGSAKNLTTDVFSLILGAVFSGVFAPLKASSKEQGPIAGMLTAAAASIVSSLARTFAKKLAEFFFNALALIEGISRENTQVPGT